MRIRLLCVARTLLFAPHSAPGPRHLDRLVALAQLDLAVRYFHPAVASGPIGPGGPDGWNAAFANAVMRIADSPNEAGKTVMLIDERAISQAEHTGLFLEAANGTTFIGTPTMGANGDVTNVVLPGGISVTFTGHDVRHADGRQLQRVGLQPQITVAATIDGIRAGRGEVLETALEFLGGTGEVPADTGHDIPAAVAIPLANEPAAEGWSADGTPSAFRIGVDRTTAHNGSASGHITARISPATGLGTLVQTLSPDSLRGRRVRFSAFIRSKDAVSANGGGMLFIQVLGGGGSLAFAAVAEPRI